jgi:hypothetical protein
MGNGFSKTSAKDITRPTQRVIISKSVKVIPRMNNAGDESIVLFWQR